MVAICRSAARCTLAFRNLLGELLMPGTFQDWHGLTFGGCRGIQARRSQHACTDRFLECWRDILMRVRQHHRLQHSHPCPNQSAREPNGRNGIEPRREVRSKVQSRHVGFGRRTLQNIEARVVYLNSRHFPVILDNADRDRRSRSMMSLSLPSSEDTKRDIREPRRMDGRPSPPLKRH
jgi:hypothetical protein